MKGWGLGYLLAMALHTLGNSSVLWLWFREVHWSILPLFQVHIAVALLVAFFCWYRIYRLAEEDERKRGGDLN